LNPAWKIRAAGIVDHEMSLIILPIHAPRGGQLLVVGNAPDEMRPFLRSAQCWKQQSGKNRDNSDHD